MLIPFLTLNRKKRKKNLPWAKLGFGCSLTVSILLLILSTSLLLGYMNLVEALPSLVSLPVQLDPENGELLQPIRLYDRSGTQLIYSSVNPKAVNSQYVSIDTGQPNHLPDTLINATLAAIDPNYWEGKPFDLAQLDQPDLHPTLAQKFIYEVLLSKEEPGLKRSLRERLLAAQAVQKYGKDQILEWYLNSTRYGPGIYGADAASLVYFNKPVVLLTTSEAAYLAAIAENPQANLWDYPQSVVDRHLEIIRNIKEQGWITVNEEKAASQEKLTLQPETSIYNLTPSFTDYVFEQLHTQFPDENFERGGWKIITTLDLDLQQQAECILDNLVNPEKTATNTGETESSFQCKAAQFLSTTSLQSSLKPENLNGSVIVLNPKNGQILTMVGDAQIYHPAGTLLNPIVYLAAFSRGINPGSLIWDIPVKQPTTTISNQPIYEYHGPMRVRTALVNDYSQPLKTLYSQLGENVVKVTANQLGLQLIPNPESPATESNLLENSQISLLDVTHTFALFSNQGILAGQSPGQASNLPSTKIEPTSIIRVEDIHQLVWLDWSHPVTQSVLTPQLSYLMNHILSDETARWPTLGHPNPLEIGRPAGAKIGVTANRHDNWTVGYTPQNVIGVWLGHSNINNSNIPHTLSAGVWRALMQYSNQGNSVETWEPPAGINFLDVCDPSGLLPTTYCPTIVTEVFITGSEPTQTDYLYQVFQVNRETGRLATVFTPPELIEEKIYLVAPVEAAFWAKQTGLPAPPDDYDVIYTPPASKDAHFTVPEMFSHVRGEVEFKGTADGNNFDYYRLQIGQGLNPQVWTQLSEDTNKAVENDVLGTWDSTNQSGLYSVQLLVIGKDQRVDRAVMQITVDNTPPSLDIINPSNDQIIDRKTQPNIVFNVQAYDNLEIDRVEFFIDETLLTSLPSFPFYISWPASLGKHTLIVRAYDLAGNTVESTVNFLVK